MREGRSEGEEDTRQGRRYSDRVKAMLVGC